ncbi:MAG: HNH endonuclease [Thiohalomonadaceae bacterium]
MPIVRQKGGKLNVHHVWPFQRFPELKFEVSNLVTLCKICHDGFHKAAGGAVKVAIGPFFHALPTQVKEVSGAYMRRISTFGFKRFGETPSRQ